MADEHDYDDGPRCMSWEGDHFCNEPAAVRDAENGWGCPFHTELAPGWELVPAAQPALLSRMAALLRELAPRSRWALPEVMETQIRALLTEYDAHKEQD